MFLDLLMNLPLAEVAHGAAADAAKSETVGNLIATFALLVGLELVLGIDNIVVIAILVQRLPKELQNKARVLGLSLAVLFRFVALGLVVWLSNMTADLFNVFGIGFSIRDLILLAGGLYLLKQAVKEIHHVVEFKGHHPSHEEKTNGELASHAFRNAVLQIVALDIVFSLDSVITAVGLTTNLFVIITAVLVSFGAVLAYARQVGDFILAHPTLKILALSFLVTIGVTLVMESFGAHVPKGYIYLPMAFALGVELLQMRWEHNKKSKSGAGAAH